MIDKDMIKIIAGIYSTAVWGFVVINFTGFMELNFRLLNMAYTSRLGGLLAVIPFLNLLGVIYLPVAIIGAIKGKDKPATDKPKT